MRNLLIPFNPRLARAAALAFSAALAASAQTNPATLGGTVLDPTSAVIPGAEVVLIGGSGGESRRAQADQTGMFEFASLPPGSYALRVVAEGFSEKRLEALTLAAGERLELTVRLTPEMLSQNVTVSAARSEAPLSALPNAVTLLDKESIDQQRLLSDNLSSVLAQTVPSFGPSLQKLAGRGESLRGRNPLYLINGVPQHNALRDGQRDGHTIDLDFVEQVEVISGSNSIQGIGATGGVVNMQTKSAPRDGSWRQDIRVALNAADDLDGDGFAPKGSYLLGKRVGKFDLVGGASIHKRELFFDAEGRPIGLFPTQGDIMDSTSHNFYFRSGFEPTSSQRLSFSVNRFELQRDANYVVALGNRAAGRLTSAVRGDPRPVVGDPAKNEVTTWSFDYRDRDLLGGDAVVQGFFQDFNALFEGGELGGFFRLTPDGPPFLDQSAIQSEKLGLKFTHSFPEQAWRGFTPRFGLDLLRDRSSQILAQSGREWVPETDFIEIAPFFQLEQRVGRLALSGGLRFEEARLEVDDFTTIASAGSTFVSGGDPSFNETLPNVGATFDLGGGFSIYGSFAQGFTMPDVGRVLRAVSAPDRDVDDFLDLQPVVTDNSEFGARFSRGGFRAQANYYRSTSDQGSILELNEALFFEVRRERTEIEGVEASADLFVHDRVKVGGAYAWLKGEFDSDGDGDVDSDLDGTNIAPNRVNAYVQAFPASWLSGRLQISTLLDRDFRGPAAPDDADFDGYAVVDLMLNFQTKAGLIRFGVENLLDNQYLTFFSQTEPAQRNDTIFAGRGRNFTVVFEPRLWFGR